MILAEVRVYYVSFKIRALSGEFIDGQLFKEKDSRNYKDTQIDKESN